MTTAFAGDAARKSVLLDRIDRALADETLSFAPSAGMRADPIAAAIDGGDPSDYGQAFGYPPALVGAMPRVAERLDEDGAMRFVRDWVSVVTPGADLSGIAAQLMLDLLDDPCLRHGDAVLTGRLIALHRRPGPSPEEWTALRRDVVRRANASTDPAEQATITVWEEACWPVGSGRGVLAATFVAWHRLGGFAPGWSVDRETETFVLLEQLQQAHDASGDITPPDYAAALRRARPDLADGFERNLDFINGRALDRARLFATRMIRLLADAKQSPDRCALSHR